MKSIRKYFSTVFNNEKDPYLNTVIPYRCKHLKGYLIKLIKDNILQSRPLIKVNLDLVFMKIFIVISQTPLQSHRAKYPYTTNYLFQVVRKHKWPLIHVFWRYKETTYAWFLL